jgi:2-succinyl-5-enolpyruvyl-6-hydroxy-3-cyclohexene-1-carboxylate synthase
MKFSSKILSQTITELCRAKDIEHIVISPGSRNAPLTIGFTEHDFFTNYSIVDERCAAFFAIGIAQQLRKPVALVCTSGSALLNYYPAVAEAFYSDIPLVVLSADRPAHLIDIGDGQTIRQENVFANHILFSASCKEGSEFQHKNEQLVNEALNIAISKKGPVHINLPFSEPLYETLDSPVVIPANIPAKKTRASTYTEQLSALINDWNNAERKMVLVGVLSPNSINQNVIDFLGQDPGTIVFTETTSNLHHDNFFPAIDQMIAPLDDVGFKKLQPQLLITFGGMVVSKKIKAFLRKYPAGKHYHLDEKRAMDTFFILNSHLPDNPQRILESLQSENKKVSSSYRNEWLQVRSKRLQLHKAYEGEIPFSDFKVFSEVFKAIPHDRQLQLANSATIRYAQLFELDPSWEVFCNRGTSGIDGSTSTAIGAALISSRPTVYITGDLSFFYDSNALWNNYIPAHFRIIIINNSGGGIFRILPGKNDTENFSSYFETSHKLNAKALAVMYRFEYRKAQDETSLRQALKEFFEPGNKPGILEVFTPSEINDKVLLGYFDYIS